MVPRSLRADCTRCAALCCVGPGFVAGPDFAIDKAEGVPCPNLGARHACAIHDALAERGFPACVAYDCFGAGQRVVSALGGPERVIHSVEVSETFLTMRALHALLWALDQAGAWCLPARRGPLHAWFTKLDATAESARGAVLDACVSESWGAVVELLERCVDDLRPTRRVLVDADLSGRDLRSWDLRDADLRFANLAGTDLRDVDLGRADLLGADLRRARLEGADLSSTLFLSQVQLGLALGDGQTRLAIDLEHPAAWGGER